MAVSPERPRPDEPHLDKPRHENGRRRRYRPAAVAGRLVVTPPKRALLEAVARLEVASLPQLARLTGPSEQSARRHLRELFDHGLVRVIPVSRFVLADGEAANDASLLFGSAPNIYTLTRRGARELERVGGRPPERLRERYGPRNTYFLAHELGIRDVRVWLELTARRHPGHTLERWEDGGAAEISLESPATVTLPGGKSGVLRKVLPDAWFVYRLPAGVLVGFVEVDRGTERGERRWGQKLAAYTRLLTSGELKRVTGYHRARILTFTPAAARREVLARFIERDAPPETVASFWFTAPDGWSAPDFSTPCWRRGGTTELQPLLPNTP